MHSGKKRTDIKSEDQLEKDRILSDRIMKAMEGFLKIRNSWRDSKKPIDEMLKYSLNMIVL